MSVILAVASLALSLDMQLPVKGQYVYHRWERNVDGTPRRYKVTSVQMEGPRSRMVKKIGLKRGLKQFSSIKWEHELRAFTHDPADVLPKHFDCGCGGDETASLLEGDEVLYVFNPTSRQPSTWNFSRRCEI
jgi:hypothetical protein